MSKADRNKKASERYFATVILASLSAPLFVTLGEGLILSKVIPSVLSLLAGAATVWLQLRKPQQLWALYRDAQRRLEHEKALFSFRAGSYRTAKDAERRLAERVAAIALAAHERWLPNVPSTENLPVAQGTPVLAARRTPAGPELGEPMGTVEKYES